MCAALGAGWAYDGTQHTYKPEIEQSFQWSVGHQSDGPYFRYNFTTVWNSDTVLNVGQLLQKLNDSYGYGFVNIPAGLNETITGKEIIISGSVPLSLSGLAKDAFGVLAPYGISPQPTNSTDAVVKIEVF